MAYRSLVAVGMLLGLISVVAAPPAAAQGTWGLEDRNYYEPLISEIRAATVKSVYWGQSDEFSFMLEPGERRIWDLALGKEIALFGYETGEGQGAPFLPGE